MSGAGTGPRRGPSSEVRRGPSSEVRRGPSSEVKRGPSSEVRRGPSGCARSVVPGVVLVLGLALSLIGCIVNRLSGPQLTGTCDGACAHYVQCKPGHRDADRTRCSAECPDVFSDRDSLMAYETLTCDDAVDFIDGHPAKTAAHR